jgi:diaminohydroxyphosphoribosylaminopyrimidine deaminase/5-amino-6-(5-phosphoribosylamino)uracil reductase
MLTSVGADPARRQAMTGAGVELIDVARSELGVDLAQALQALAKRGITRLLVEGGASLAAALLRSDLVDRVVWFHAPSVTGADGWPAAQAFGVQHLTEMKRFTRDGVRAVGADMMSEFRRAA